MLKIIINADDLGGFQPCNDAIFDLMARGKISSSTLMANGPFFADAVARARAFPHYSFGVHLNISQFFPLVPNPVFRRAGMLEATGEFRHRKFIVPTVELVRAIREEWYAQVAKIRDAGIVISHIDSHRHTHTRLWMGPILKFLCQKFAIKKIRSKFARQGCSCRGGLIRRLIRQLRGMPNRILLAKVLKLQSPDHFADMESGLVALSTLKFEGDLTFELMCHPGGENFPREYPLLKSDYESQILSPYRLISYHEL
jgi:predicted glycoside hydrolase/deacetylase ChbG (UPF0249 family)